jgi:hypothetical protein
MPFDDGPGEFAEAADVLVVEPAKEVFLRCLGCRTSGRKEKIAN